MTTQRWQVAVVGAGTAGAASALFLARNGHAVTVFERVERPEAVGAGIMLQPTGLAVLDALKLSAPILAAAEPIDRLHLQTPGAARTMTLDYRVLGQSLQGHGLHRGVLFSTLFEALRREPGVALRTGVDVIELVSASRGRRLVDAAGRSHGPFDLVVIANGARSTLRGDASLPCSVERYPWGALWAMVDDVEHRYRGRLFQVVRGTQRLIGLLPTGFGPHGGARQVSFFFSLPCDSLASFRQRDFQEWKADVLRDMPEAGPVLERFHSPEQLLFTSYHDVVMWPWNDGHVVALGDAAHAMSPQLGQGCNLALLDAWVLGEALARASTVSDGLYAYSRERRWHLGWYQRITRALTPFFQSHLSPLGVLRDQVLMPLSSWPLIQRQMVLAMAGLWRGPFFPPLALSGRTSEPSSGRGLPR